MDHLLVLSETHPRCMLREYVASFNSRRPHQGLQQRIPDLLAVSSPGVGIVYATPVLGGLHHTYSRAA
jgi:putative transposase